jgi:hypothetical protein
MATKIRFVLGAWIALAAAPLGLRAADDGTSAPGGHVLVLENEHTLEGDIEREGDQYRVRRSIGETRVPADQVLRLCANLEEAYAYLGTRANLRDPDERLRLAHWCQQHGLREQALAEAAASVRLQPGNRESLRLLQHLQRTVPAGKAAEEAEPPHAAAAPIDLDMESLSQFATHVQPILMNTCATCHVADRGGSFKLVRAYEAGLINRRSTQQNLAAVLAQVNRQQWLASPFLTKALSIHGEMAQPPLKGRQTPAYRTLEEWVQNALAHNPALQDHVQVAATAALGPEPAEKSAGGEWAVEAKVKGQEKPALPLPPPAMPPPDQVAGSLAAVPGNEDGRPKLSGPPPAVKVPGPPAEPADAFDPVIFNRQMHPSAN